MHVLVEIALELCQALVQSNIGRTGILRSLKAAGKSADARG
jgi:hypothetical protein